MFQGQVIPFSSFFQLTYLTNTGIAFGMFRGANIVFLVTTALIICAVCVWYWKNRKDMSISLNLSLLLIISGAVGNLIDRVLRGHVIDFLEFHINSHYWPAFNIADSCITVGGTILFLSVLLSPKKS